MGSINFIQTHFKEVHGVFNSALVSRDKHFNPVQTWSAAVECVQAVVEKEMQRLKTKTE